jgi:hypothetical protein
MAERMGYRPMAQAQAIRTGRARSLGLVLNAGRSDAHKPFLTDFLDGISRAASEESWTLTVATAEDEADEVATMARLVDERKVDGFILPRTKTRDARIALLRARDVPFILYGRTAGRHRLRLVRHRRRRRDPGRRPAPCRVRPPADRLYRRLAGVQLFAAASAGVSRRHGGRRAGRPTRA